MNSANAMDDTNICVICGGGHTTHVQCLLSKRAVLAEHERATSLTKHTERQWDANLSRIIAHVKRNDCGQSQRSHTKDVADDALEESQSEEHKMYPCKMAHESVGSFAPANTMLAFG